MDQAAKAARNAYAKEYRAKNKDRINEQARQYRQVHPERMRASYEKYWANKAEKMAQAAGIAAIDRALANDNSIVTIVNKR